MRWRLGSCSPFRIMTRDLSSAVIPFAIGVLVCAVFFKLHDAVSNTMEVLEYSSSQAEKGVRFRKLTETPSKSEKISLPIRNDPLEYKTTLKCKNKQLSFENFMEKVLYRSVIFKPFDGKNFNPAGWTNLAPIFEKILAKYLDQHSETEDVRIIEIGSWMGKSARDMASVCKKLTNGKSKNCTLIAVDTWTGSSEHYEWEQLPRDEYGRPLLFDIFMNNVKFSNLTDIITPLRLPSISASHVLYCYNVLADFIFVDAEHDYPGVKKDLELFFPLLRKGGILFGDDYGWSGVKKAVDEFAIFINRAVHVKGGKTWFIVSKESSLE